VAGPASLSAADLARAARLLTLRSRREASGLFAGNYASAFRGGGLEFEESRPYVPGDDVSTIDWNAAARTGELFVKRFREERNQTLLFGLDVSASMGFGSAGRSKAATAAHALALVASAAARAGDRTGLVAFDAGVRGEVAPGRGGAHGLRVIRAAVAWAGAPRGATRLEGAVRALLVHARRRCVIFLLSDFRDPDLLPAPSGAARGRAPVAEAPARLGGALAELARRHDVIAAPLVDPADEELPELGSLLVSDPERPASVRLLRTGSASLRRRYREAARAARARLARELRRSGVECVWLRTDRSPLHALARFFRERAARRISP
jgi:uncharacterized protein (DUF58 family)